MFRKNVTLFIIHAIFLIHVFVKKKKLKSILPPVNPLSPGWVIWKGGNSILNSPSIYYQRIDTVSASEWTVNPLLLPSANSKTRNESYACRTENRTQILKVHTGSPEVGFMYTQRIDKAGQTEDGSWTCEKHDPSNPL